MNPGASLKTVVTDVTKREDMEMLHAKTLETYSKVHLLFSNAGAAGPRSVFADRLVINIRHANITCFFAEKHGIGSWL
jgi:NADP-dependent 3-hydroxy acid dehydrogenase YdfG